MSIEDLRGDIQRALAHLQRKDLESFKAVWLQSKLNSTGIQQRFKDWKTNSGNENVLYWAYFIDTVYPVLRSRSDSCNQNRKLEPVNFSKEAGHGFVLCIRTD